MKTKSTLILALSILGLLLNPCFGHDEEHHKHNNGDYLVIVSNNAEEPYSFYCQEGLEDYQVVYDRIAAEIFDQDEEGNLIYDSSKYDEFVEAMKPFEDKMEGHTHIINPGEAHTEHVSLQHFEDHLIKHLHGTADAEFDEGMEFSDVLVSMLHLSKRSDKKPIRFILVTEEATRSIEVFHPDYCDKKYSQYPEATGYLTVFIRSHYNEALNHDRYNWVEVHQTNEDGSLHCQCFGSYSADIGQYSTSDGYYSIVDGWHPSARHRDNNSICCKSKFLKAHTKYEL